MEYQTNLLLFEKRPIVKSKFPAVKWYKEWVPQEIPGTGAKCYLLKWVTEDMLNALREKHKEPDPDEQEPEAATEVLFLCSYEGCGKTFIDAGGLRKHSHIHGEKQFICHYEGCGRGDTFYLQKFLDSSKLKRHFLIHTGERSFVCPHEGCGKAFSLDFNLRAHMKTHYQENYHMCPYEDCGKRYAHEYKLKAHIKTHHDKLFVGDVVKHAPPPERHHATPKTPLVYATPTAERPYACPYAGCTKSYIHEYKLNLHLRREHPGHNTPGENEKRTPTDLENDLDDASDQDVYMGARVVNGGLNLKRKKAKTNSKLIPPPKKAKKKSSSVRVPVDNNSAARKPWQDKEMYEDDSEETEEDRDNMEEDHWQYGDNNNIDDDEETDYED